MAERYLPEKNTSTTSDITMFTLLELARIHSNPAKESLFHGTRREWRDLHLLSCRHALFVPCVFAQRSAPNLTLRCNDTSVCLFTTQPHQTCCCRQHTAHSQSCSAPSNHQCPVEVSRWHFELLITTFSTLCRCTYTFSTHSCSHHICAGYSEILPSSSQCLMLIYLCHLIMSLIQY